MLCVSEEIPVSHEEIVELHRKLDALADAVQEMAKSNVQLSTVLAAACKTQEKLEQIVAQQQTDLTTIKGKVALIMWFFGVVATIILGLLVAGIWQIAFKV